MKAETKSSRGHGHVPVRDGQREHAAPRSAPNAESRDGQKTQVTPSTLRLDRATLTNELVLRAESLARRLRDAGRPGSELTAEDACDIEAVANQFLAQAQKLSSICDSLARIPQWPARAISNANPRPHKGAFLHRAQGQQKQLGSHASPA
jgi:hypothetical protein